MAKKRKSHKFLKMTLSYALYFMIFIGIIMLVLWLYLSQFERSQVNFIIQNNVDNISLKQIKKDAKDVLESVNSKFQTKEQAEKALYDLIHKETSCTKDTVNSKADYVIYNLQADGIPYGTISLQKEEKKTLLGFEKWDVAEKNIDYSKLILDEVISIPSDWTAYIQDKQLDAEYITNYEKHYSMLEGFYGSSVYLPLPYLLEYHIGNTVGHLPITVKDSAGNSYAYKDVNEEMYLAKADEGTTNSIQEFMYGFLPGYVQCLSNANHNAYGNYYALTPYLLSGSNLDVRLYNAIEGQAWANSGGDVIVDIQFNNCLSLQNGLYLSDVTYVVETYGLNGAVQSSQNAKVLLVQSETGYLVADLETY